MRNPHRIPILIELFKRDSVKESYLRNVVGLVEKAMISKFLLKWKQKENEVERFWKENPDYRMSQVLISVGVLPNLSGNWFYMEDEEFMDRYGIADKRSTTIWLRNFNKYGDRLEIPKPVPLNKMSDDHLKNIEKWYNDLESDIPVVIEKEIAYRELHKITVAEEGNGYYIDEGDEDF